MVTGCFALAVPSTRPHIFMMLVDDWGSYDASYRVRSGQWTRFCSYILSSAVFLPISRLPRRYLHAPAILTSFHSARAHKNNYFVCIMYSNTHKTKPRASLED